jgi:hypothetical protein
VVATADFAGDAAGDLSFVIGEEIIVVDDTQAWWRGYRVAEPSKEGEFPSNYVETAPAADSGGGGGGDTAASAGAAAPAVPAVAAAPAADTAAIEVVLGAADFDADQATDLGFKIGDRIVVTAKAGDWWDGYLESDASKTTGQFPSNYVDPLPADDSGGGAAAAPAAAPAPAAPAVPAAGGGGGGAQSLADVSA